MARFVPSGLIVPIVTPFKGTSMSEVDVESFDRLVDYLIEGGVSGLMPLGTSGEFALMNLAEKEAVVRRVVDRTNGRVPVVAGVSEPGTTNAVLLARKVKDIGADAMIATGPFYYKTNDYGLLNHYQMLLEQVELPLMIYNIPAYTGYNIPPSVVKSLADKNQGRVTGVKFTTNDLSLFLEYLRLVGNDMQVMIGADSIFIAALELGAAGGVLGSANVLPRETRGIFDNYSRGNNNEARRLQALIDGFTEVMGIGTYPAAIKFALRLLKLPCGEVRPPLVPLKEEEQEKVKKSLAWKINQ